MMIFVVYAAIVWYAACRWRRRWPSFAAVTLGLFGMYAILQTYSLISEWTGIRIVGSMVRALLYPFTALLGLVGYYVACLPRSPGEGSLVPCTACGYDLVGMEEIERLICPECGSPHASDLHGPRTFATLAEPPGLESPAMARPVRKATPRHLGARQ